METITVAELRQNPTAALKAVEAGETYAITRYRRVIARLVPNDASADTVPLTPARTHTGARLASRPVWTLRTATSVDDLLADMRSDR